MLFDLEVSASAALAAELGIFPVPTEEKIWNGDAAATTGTGSDGCELPGSPGGLIYTGQGLTGGISQGLGTLLNLGDPTASGEEATPADRHHTLTASAPVPGVATAGARYMRYMPGVPVDELSSNRATLAASAPMATGAALHSNAVVLKHVSEPSMLPAIRARYGHMTTTMTESAVALSGSEAGSSAAATCTRGLRIDVPDGSAAPAALSHDNTPTSQGSCAAEDALSPLKSSRRLLRLEASPEMRRLQAAQQLRAEQEAATRAALREQHEAMLRGAAEAAAAALRAAEPVPPAAGHGSVGGSTNRCSTANGSAGGSAGRNASTAAALAREYQAADAAGREEILYRLLTLNQQNNSQEQCSGAARVQLPAFPATLLVFLTPQCYGMSKGRDCLP